MIKNRLLIFVGFAFLSFFFFFLLTKKNCPFLLEGFFFLFVWHLSPHTFLFASFFFFFSSVYTSEGPSGVSSVCLFSGSFFFHSWPHPSLESYSAIAILILFSHTHVDISISFLCPRGAFFLPLVCRMKTLGCGDFSLSFHSADFFQGVSLVTNINLKQYLKLKKTFQKTRTGSGSKDTVKHGFRTSKLRTWSLALLSILVCIYVHGHYENSAKVLHSYQKCKLIRPSSSLLCLDSMLQTDCFSALD